MGSCSRATTACISSSRTIKLVAEVSSSMSSTRLPASNASAMLAACEVLPLASRVENRTVSLPLGRWLIKRETSVLVIFRPSSARIFRAEDRVITYSRPSPATWSYTPRSRALRRVDLPW